MGSPEAQRKIRVDSTFFIEIDIARLPAELPVTESSGNHKNVIEKKRNTPLEMTFRNVRCPNEMKASIKGATSRM